MSSLIPDIKKNKLPIAVLLSISQALVKMQLLIALGPQKGIMSITLYRREYTIRALYIRMRKVIFLEK